MEIKKAAYVYLASAMDIGLHNFGEKEWEKVCDIADEAQYYQKEKFVIPEFSKLVIGTSILALNENKEEVSNWSVPELELFSICFAYDKFSALYNGEDFSLKEKMKEFDKEVLQAVLQQKLGKRDAMEFMWNIEGQLYEIGMDKEDVLHFINNSNQETIKDFTQDAYQKDAEFLEKNQDKVGKLCL